MLKHFEILFEIIRSIFIPPKETKLTFNEIGLTIIIPKGLRILSDEQIRKRAKKKLGAAESSFVIIARNNADCIPLFYAKNAENSFMSGIMFRLKDKTEYDALQDYNEYIESYWKSIDKENAMYARLYIEKVSTKLIIGNVAFDRDEISWRMPERKISCFYSYHGLHKGFQIAITAAFTNQEFGIGILKSIENASFV